VVDLAQRQAVRHDRFSVFVHVGEDVRGVQQLGVAKPTRGARLPVRVLYPLAERRLVQPNQRLARDVQAPCLGRNRRSEARA